jgi:hypothetical protein
MIVEYQWSKDRFLEACKANYDLKMKSLKLKLLGYFGIIFIFVGAYFSYTKGVYTTLVVSSLLVIYWYILRWPLYRLQLSFNFKKHVSKDKTVSWLINRETFSIASENGGGSYKWSAITDISESKAGFLVRQYPVFYWLPKDSFESESDIDWFRNEVMGKITINKQTT